MYIKLIIELNLKNESKKSKFFNILVYISTIYIYFLEGRKRQIINKHSEF